MFRMRRRLPTFLKLTTICDVRHVISFTRPSSPLVFPTREEGLGTRLGKPFRAHNKKLILSGHNSLHTLKCFGRTMAEIDLTNREIDQKMSCDGLRALSLVPRLHPSQVGLANNDVILESVVIGCLVIEI